jgi:hypothetical protein
VGGQQEDEKRKWASLQQPLLNSQAGPDGWSKQRQEQSLVTATSAPGTPPPQGGTRVRSVCLLSPG